MHIHILIPGIYKTHEELQISHMASVRFRAAIIAKYLPQHGSTVSFGETIPETSNIILVGKIGLGDLEKRQKLWLNQILAGVLGFEPRDAGTKNRCLTAWLYPNKFYKDNRNS